MKRFLLYVLAALTALSLCACGNSGSGAPYNKESDYDFESPSEESYRDYAGWESTNTAASQAKQEADATKMIYRASLELETLDFDKAQQDIEDLVGRYGGYYEDRTESAYGSGYRYARYTIRIPAARFSEFFHEAGDVCHTVRRDSSQENVSDAYYDVEARLQTARTKLTRLQELLARAENMADIIVIEDAIAETELTIDSLSGTLRNYDRLVDYSTVTVMLDEVYRYTGTGDAPLTLGQRLGAALSEGLASVGEFFEGLLVWLAYSWLWLILLAAAAFVCVHFVRKRVAKKRLRAPTKEE